MSEHQFPTSARDEAQKLTVALRDLTARDGESAAFATRLDATRTRQLRRRGFFDLWKRAGEVA